MTGVLAMLFGSAGYTVNLPASITASHEVVTPSTATASIAFKRNGVYQINGSDAGDWVTPRHATVGDMFDVKLDYTGGTTPTSEGAADDTYVQISSTCTWTNTRNTIGTKTTTGSLYIRRTGAASSLDSATFTIEAIVDAA